MARILIEDESSFATQLMKEIALRPANNPHYGRISMRWKSEIDRAPNNLDASEFEHWLYRGGYGN
jgi:hypothetical protein